MPAGTDVARFTSTSGAAGDDVDLYVYRDGVLLDGSTGSSPEAEVTADRPRRRAPTRSTCTPPPPRTARAVAGALADLGGPAAAARLR